jgi:hypothetical protein
MAKPERGSMNYGNAGGGAAVSPIHALIH